VKRPRIDDTVSSGNKRKRSGDEDDEAEDRTVKKPRIEDAVSSNGQGPVVIRRRAPRPVPSRKRGGLAVPQPSTSGHASPAFQATTSDLVEPGVEDQHSEAHVPSEDVGQDIEVVAEQSTGHTDAVAESSAMYTEAVVEQADIDFTQVAAKLINVSTELAAELYADMDVSAALPTGHEWLTDPWLGFPPWGMEWPELLMDEQGPANGVGAGEGYVEPVAEPPSPLSHVDEQGAANDVGEGQGFVPQFHHGPCGFSWLNDCTSQPPVVPTGQPSTAAFTDNAAIQSPMALANTLAGGVGGVYPASAALTHVDARSDPVPMVANPQVGTIVGGEMSGEEADGVHLASAAPAHVDARSDSVPIEAATPFSTAVSSSSNAAPSVLYAGVDAKYMRARKPPSSYLAPNPVRRPFIPSTHDVDNRNYLAQAVVNAGIETYEEIELVPSFLKICDRFLLVRYRREFLDWMHPTGSFFLNGEYVGFRKSPVPVKGMESEELGVAMNCQPGVNADATGVTGEVYLLPEPQPLPSPELELESSSEPELGSSSESEEESSSESEEESSSESEEESSPEPEEESSPEPELEQSPSPEPELFVSESSSYVAPQIELDPDLDVTPLMDRQSSLHSHGTETGFLGEAPYTLDAPTSHLSSPCDDDPWPAPTPDEWSQCEDEVVDRHDEAEFVAVQEPVAESSGTQEGTAYPASFYTVPSGSAEQYTSWNPNPWMNRPQFPSLPAMYLSAESSLSSMVQVHQSSTTAPLEPNVADDDDVPPGKST
jgi:hypothetical protein